MDGAGSGKDLSVLFDLFTANQRARRLLALTMADSPLKPDEYAVYSLVLAEGPVSPTEMAHRLGTPVTTVLDHVRGMESRRHVVRSANPDDGRSYLLALTESGRAVHRSAGVAFNAAMGPLLRHLAADEAEVHRALAALAAAMDAAVDDLER